MKKSTKGALSAAAAGTLLLGGAGSYAFWTSSQTVDGGSVASGSMSLGALSCSAGWKHSENDVAVTKIVPGDNIYEVCTGTLTLDGDHIAADVALNSDSIDTVSGDLGAEIVASADLTAPASGSVTGSGAHPVTIKITVDFPGAAATNDSQSGTAALNGLVVDATQTHVVQP